MKKRKRKEKFTDYGRRETISTVITFILVIAVSLWLLSCSTWWLVLIIPVDGLLLLDWVVERNRIKQNRKEEKEFERKEKEVREEFESKYGPIGKYINLYFRPSGMRKGAVVTFPQARKILIAGHLHNYEDILDCYCTDSPYEIDIKKDRQYTSSVDVIGSAAIGYAIAGNIGGAIGCMLAPKKKVPVVVRTDTVHQYFVHIITTGEDSPYTIKCSHDNKKAEEIIKTCSECINCSI